jgi:putative ABC transport system permease protein
MHPMHRTRQYFALLRMNLTGITQRPGLVLTIVIGVTCAVGVLVSMLAMGVGARRQAMGNVRDDRIILMSTGAQSTMQSSIPKDVATSIRDLPGIKQSANGQPVAVSAVLIIMEARTRLDDSRIYFPLLGVSTGLPDLLPEMHLTAGRMFQPGLHELIADKSCARQYTAFDIDDKRSIRGSDWVIVGHFELGNAQGKCVVYADAQTVFSAFGLNNYNHATVMLQSATRYDDFLRALRANPALHVEAKHEREVVEDEFKGLNGILNFVSYFVGVIMAIAATLGAVNSMYALVDARRRELATLRAIGFGSDAIVVSILSESILLALPGALLGGALAWAFFNGLSASPFGFSFQLAVTPSLVALGIVWALGMGLLGGLLPALRAARVPVTTALRAV